MPAGAFTKPPVPVLTFTCAVKVCVWPIRFVAVGGVIWMFASTKVLTASPEFCPVPSVWIVNGAEPLTESVAEAWPVTLPAVGEVKVIVHWPEALVFGAGVVQVPVRRRYGSAPFESVSVTVTCSFCAGTNTPVRRCPSTASP